MAHRPSRTRLTSVNDRDEQFLLELHEALDKRAIEIDDPAYLPLHEQPGEVSGPDAVKLLSRTLTRTAPGGTFFLTGLRGSGKTVQLKRLKRQLRERGYGVVMFSAEDYLNMHEPLDVVDVLFFLVGAISDQAVSDGLIKKGDAADSPGWSRLRDWLHGLPGRVQFTGGEAGVDFRGVGCGQGEGLAEGRAARRHVLRRATA